MTALHSGTRDARLAGNITSAFSGPSQATEIETLVDEFTIATGDVATSSIDFVPFTKDGYLELELSRLRIGGLITPALSITSKLQKVAVAFNVLVGITSASAAVTTSVTGLLVGQSITGTGIPASTTISAITATGFTMSAVATATDAALVAVVSGAADITAAVASIASAATAATAAQALPFVPLNGGPPVTFAKGDKLRLVIVAVTSLGIGRTLIPSIPYVSRQAPGLRSLATV